MLDSRAFRTGFAVVLLFTLLAGDAWRYSLSWYGFGAIVAALVTVAISLLVRERKSWSFATLPIPLLAFMALAVVSIVWSAYPRSSALGIVATAITVLAAIAAAVVFTWEQLVRALSIALKLIIGLSLAFELVVAVFVRHPVLPFWVDYPEGKLPKMLFWSRDVLFDGGTIQGIVGNSSLLAFVALLGVIVFGIQLATGRVTNGWGWFWMLMAAVTIALTRSPTIYVALATIAFVLVAVWLLRRAKRRAPVYAGLAAVVVLAVATVILAGDKLLALVGKSADLTGRLDIWGGVIERAQQRPLAGWGWISYWTPWEDFFKDKAFMRNGVQQLHAHNAWLDIWMQLGIIGLIVFGCLVLTALVRSWILATERLQTAPGQVAPFTAISLLPLLLLVALLVQSLAESRLLVEYGLFLLVLIAVKTSRRESA